MTVTNLVSHRFNFNPSDELWFLVFGKINQSIMLFRVVQVTKSLQDPLEVGNSLLGISDNVRE